MLIRSALEDPNRHSLPSDTQSPGQVDLMGYMGKIAPIDKHDANKRQFHEGWAQNLWAHIASADINPKIIVFAGSAHTSLYVTDSFYQVLRDQRKEVSVVEFTGYHAEESLDASIQFSDRLQISLGLEELLTLEIRKRKINQEVFMIQVENERGKGPYWLINIASAGARPAKENLKPRSEVRKAMRPPGVKEVDHLAQMFLNASFNRGRLTTRFALKAQGLPEAQREKLLQELEQKVLEQLKTIENTISREASEAIVQELLQKTDTISVAVVQEVVSSVFAASELLKHVDPDVLKQFTTQLEEIARLVNDYHASTAEPGLTNEAVGEASQYISHLSQIENPAVIAIGGGIGQSREAISKVTEWASVAPPLVFKIEFESVGQFA